MLARMDFRATTDLPLAPSFRFLMLWQLTDSGNVFIADAENNRIRKVAANGITTTVAGSLDAALTRASSDRKWLVRAAAVYAIAKRGDPALLSAITPALDDKNDTVKYDASAAVLRLSSRTGLK